MSSSDPQRLRRNTSKNEGKPKKSTIGSRVRGRPSGSSGSSKISERSLRQENSIFTFVDQINAGRNTGPDPIQRQRLLANQPGDFLRSVSRENGRLNLINQSSSSSSDNQQFNRPTYFTLVEIESTKDIESRRAIKESSKDYSYTQKFSNEFKKLDDIIPKINPVDRQNSRVEVSSGNTSTKINTQTLLHKKLASSTSVNMAPAKPLDPQELMRKLKEISETRRTYYVQKTGSDDDSLLDKLMQSPPRFSIDSMISLPFNPGRDNSISMQVLAGSMTTLKFMELSKRKPGSLGRDVNRDGHGGDDHKVLRVKQCELSVPPIDVYRRELIIDEPIYPISSVEPQDTVDAPLADAVVMINQICDVIDNIFKNLHTGFDDSRERIKKEEAAAKEKEKPHSQTNDYDKMLLLDLRMSLFPPVARRSEDVTRRSMQSIGSRQSMGSSFTGELPLAISQPSLTSLPLDLTEDNTDELIKILNQKYEKSLDLESNVSSASHESEQRIRLLYSSQSEPLERQESDNQLDTGIDYSFQNEFPEHESTMYSASSRKSSVRGSLRRFTAKVQIPTIEDDSIEYESREMKVSAEETQEGAREENRLPAISQSKQSMLSRSTLGSIKIKDVEKQAIADVVESEFGEMQLYKMDVNPSDELALKSQSEFKSVLAEYTGQINLDETSCDIFEGEKLLTVETGTTKQLMLHKCKFPQRTESEECGSIYLAGHIAKHHKEAKKPNVSETDKEHDRKDDQRELDEGSDAECAEWVTFNPNLHEDGKKPENEEEEGSEPQKEVEGLVVDAEELRWLFPFAFRLSLNSSWWKRPRFSDDYRGAITKEMIPEFEELRDLLKAFLEEYVDNYTRFETVYRWGDPKDPPEWNKRYRSPFLRPDVSLNQEPNRFHLSDDALSMRDTKQAKNSGNQPPGYSTASFYVEPTKWWNLANVRRYVLRKKLAQHSLEGQRMRLGLRAKPTMFSASLILGSKTRRRRKKGQICRRKKNANKTWVAMFMKRNLPRTMWKELKAKYELTNSLKYHQRHHWNPFHPSNKPSIDGNTRLGWFGRSLVRRNNITFLGQFAKGVDEKQHVAVREVTDSEVRNRWQRDIMEMAYVAFCTNKLITEELQFLVIIGFWLGVVIDEFSYFMRFVVNEMAKNPGKKTIHERKHPHEFRARLNSEHQTEKKNSKIWEKILKVCDKTLFMLRRGLLPVETAEQPESENVPPPNAEFVLSIPWYENTQLRRTNRRLLDSIALAYPDFYYLANKSNKYYHVELDGDEAKWFPIRYYDADTGGRFYRNRVIHVRVDSIG